MGGMTAAVSLKGRAPWIMHVWMPGGDYLMPPDERWAGQELALGIREGGARQLMTAHGGQTTAVETFGEQDWLAIDNVYRYDTDIWKSYRQAYRNRPVRPFVLIETAYEGEHHATPDRIRRQAWWAVLSGACGQFFGNNPIWPFNHGWQQALDLPGSWSMVHLKALFTSRPWYLLVPDVRHELITTGLGEFRGLDYLAAARSYDGGTAIAYMPTARPITVNLTKLCGSTIIAWWFDPRTGEAQPAGEFPADGSREFAPPGEGDWVLVLDDATRGYGPPGSAH